MAESKSSNAILRNRSLAISKLCFPLQWLYLHAFTLSLGWPPEAQGSVSSD